MQLIRVKENLNLVIEKQGTNGETIETPVALIRMDPKSEHSVVFKLEELSSDDLAKFIVDQRMPAPAPEEKT